MELERIARDHGVTVPQVILAFLMRDGRTFVIPKTSNLERIRENAGADAVVLTPRELDQIDRTFPARKRRGLATL